DRIEALKPVIEACGISTLSQSPMLAFHKQIAISLHDALPISVSMLGSGTSSHRTMPGSMNESCRIGVRWPARRAGANYGGPTGVPGGCGARRSGRTNFAHLDHPPRRAHGTGGHAGGASVRGCAMNRPGRALLAVEGGLPPIFAGASAHQGRSVPSVTRTAIRPCVGSSSV